VTDLAGTQLSSLLETLPGIANVLRSPVADAMVNLVRAASGQGPFSFADAEELLRYAMRRNLISVEESERVLAETKDALSSRPKPIAVKPEPKAIRKPAPIKKPPVKPIKVAKPVVAKKKGKPARAAAKHTRTHHKKK
jgi:hypothetical protein